ncbi:MAG: nitrous oxide reductase accessory protein NosL [Bacteroidota bacterium]
MSNRGYSFVCYLLYLIAAASLIAQDQPILRVKYDSSRCDYCRMLFQEKNFGGELETLNDSVLVFDASECEAAFLIAGKIPGSQVKGIWSVNFLKPNGLVDVNSAWYLRSDKIMSPMEANIAAFESKRLADSVQLELGGQVMDWKGVVQLIRTRWFQKK